MVITTQQRSTHSGSACRVAAFSLAAAATLAAFANVCPAQQRDQYRDSRLEMVKKYIEQEGVSNPRVLEAMRKVPRHEFVPSRQRRWAYLDLPLPIGYQQTISPPYIVAYMTESIDPQPDDRVLEIGTGSGYQAAVLSELAKEVYSIEIVEPLGRTAAKTLERLGYKNVKTKVGDGYLGWPEYAPFDKIIVTCSPESVPAPLIAQLREGGRMIIPLGERYQQVFQLLEKKEGKLAETQLIPALFVPMTGTSESERQVRPDPLRPEVINGDFELDADADELPDNWHYRRQARLESDDVPSGERCLCIENDEPGRMGQVLQGMALDGSKIGTLRLSLSVKYENAKAGTDPQEQPGLVIYFFDPVRRRLEDGTVGPWTGTQNWRPLNVDIPVPPRATEAVISIGLHGGTGLLCVDAVRLTPKPREESR